MAMKNMVCVPKAESGTKCLKMTTCEKISMFAMDTLGVVVWD